MAVCLGPRGYRHGGVLGLVMAGHAVAVGQGHARKPPQGQQSSLAQDGRCRRRRPQSGKQPQPHNPSPWLPLLRLKKINCETVKKPKPKQSPRAPLLQLSNNFVVDENNIRAWEEL